jgi:hypothetical protein
MPCALEGGMTAFADGWAVVVDGAVTAVDEEADR